ncbi:MAG: hypothetical protein J7L55_05905, partial [Desulfurococcales archaeon]|nr:hypothetical protein [Desulfurococcales archaeon]
MVPFNKQVLQALNKASTTLVIAFMLMLISAAASLALNAEALANQLAEIAYYFLVGAVILQ